LLTDCCSAEQVQVTNDDKLTICVQIGVMLSVQEVRTKIREHSSRDTSVGAPIFLTIAVPRVGSEAACACEACDGEGADNRQGAGARTPGRRRRRLRVHRPRNHPPVRVCGTRAAKSPPACARGACRRLRIACAGACVCRSLPRSRGGGLVRRGAGCEQLAQAAAAHPDALQLLPLRAPRCSRALRLLLLLPGASCDASYVLRGAVTRAGAGGEPGRRLVCARRAADTAATAATPSATRASRSRRAAATAGERCLPRVRAG
jgi:hypothetical protein